MTTAPLRRTIRTSAELDLQATLRPVRRGRGDPTTRLGHRELLRAMRTPVGPATLHLRQEGDSVEATAWGEGAGWALEQSPALLGGDDDLGGFDPSAGLVRELHRRNPGLRIGRTGLVFEATVPAVLEQRVTGFEARRSFAQIARRYGEPAPGPGELWLLPEPAVMASTPYFALHPLGVERSRADTLRRAAAAATRLEALAGVPAAQARERLRTVPGIGVWTAAEVAAVAFGDPDAVSVGDYHLKNVISYALAGEPRGTDERMLELLEPYAGHRGRVCRLIESAGIGAPRRHPRQRVQRIARL